MAWACILLPSLAIDGALRHRPAVDGPFALVAGPEQQRRLLAVNTHARDAGLYSGQRLAEAEAICRNLLTEEHDVRRLETDLFLIAAWAYRFSSEVAHAPPRAIVLEVGKSLGLFGPWPRLEARLRKGLAGLGFQHRIALHTGSVQRKCWPECRTARGLPTPMPSNERWPGSPSRAQDCRSMPP